MKSQYKYVTNECKGKVHLRIILVHSSKSQYTITCSTDWCNINILRFLLIECPKHGVQ